MKNIIKTIVTAVIMMCVFSCGAYAAQEWNLTATDGAATAVFNADTMQLSYSEGDAARSAAAECTFDFTKNKHITVSFTANVSGFDSGTKRKLYFRESSLISMEAIAFDENKFSVLGKAIPDITLEENTDYYVTLGINAESKTMVVYFNGKKVFEGSLGTSWKSGFKLASLKAYVRNYTLQKTQTGASEFILKNLMIADSATDIITEPADKAEFVEAGSLLGIDVSFNGGVCADVLNGDNFTLNDGENDCAVSAERNESGVRIKPVGGFKPDTLYTLTVKEIKDVFSNTAAENKSVSFTTAPEGYEKPLVALTADRTEMYDFQTAQLSISASSENGIDRVEMFLNDELWETFDENTQYDFYAEKGSYKIYLVAWDSMGGSAKSDVLIINIKKNSLPVIRLTGITSGVPVTKDKLGDITVSVQDADGKILYTEVYLGDRLILRTEEASFVPDLSSAELGRSLLRIVAADDSGEEVTKDISLVITGESNEKTIFESDFEEYRSDGDTFIGGAFYKGVMNAGAAIRSGDTYGDDHGTVVEYVSEGEDASSTWIYFNTYNTTQSFLFEMDTYILSEKSKVSFYFKTGSSVLDPLTFQDGKLVIGGTTGKKTVSFPAGEWHNLRILSNMNDHLFSVWIDDIPVAEDFGLKADLTNIETRISLDPMGETDMTGIVFDNLVIRYYEQPVQIVSIGYDDVDECMEIAPHASTLRLSLSSGVDPSTINKKSVLLYCGDRLMDYESVKCNDGKTVIIKLKEKLRSQTQYRAELTNKVFDSSGNILKNGAVVNFSTGYSDVDVKRALLTKTNGKIEGSAVLINTTDKNETCYMILTVLSGDETKDILVKKVTVPANREITASIGGLDISSGENGELYFRKSLLGTAITGVFRK